MASTIKLKNGSGAPLASDLVQGEPALDLTNKRLYTEDSLGAVIEVGTNPTEIQIDNINIDGNAITSTDTNGNIAITPNGTGEVDISKVDIDGGAIDGTVIGGTTTAAGSFTTLQADTSLNVDGTVTADGLTVASAENNSVSIESSDAFANLRFKDNLGSARIVTTNGSLLIQSGGDTSYTGLTGRLNIATNGDISFYEDTGATAKFFWDASAEELKLTTTSSNSNALSVSDGTYGVDLGTSSTGGIIGTYNANQTLDITTYGTGVLKFNTAATERMRIDSSGNLDMTAGGGDIIMANGAGIDFSATANSSGTMSNELLDDYEEGTYTPLIKDTAGSSTTFDTTLSYTKIGRMVYVYGRVQVTAETLGSTSTHLYINLPFTPSGAPSQGSVYLYNANTDNGNQFVVWVISTAGDGVRIVDPTNNALTYSDNTEIVVGTNLTFSFMYEAS